MDKVRIKLTIPFVGLLIVFYRKMKFYDGRTKSTTNGIVNFNLTVFFYLHFFFIYIFTFLTFGGETKLQNIGFRYDEPLARN